MFKHHKLSAVVRHEYLTIVKQPSFWISLIAVPAILGIIVAINVLTDQTKKTDPLDDRLRVSVVDETGLISTEVTKSYNLQTEDVSKKSQLEKDVKSGKIDGLIVYSRDLLQTGTYKMYADNTDAENSAAVTEIGRLVLQQSLLEPIDAQLASLVVSGGKGELTNYKNGELAREFKEYLVPGAFLVLFYIVLVFSVSYALTSVSEEKENRSIEMVLSYVKPRTLILGKLMAIILVTLTQILFIALLAVAAYFLAVSFGNELSLPFDIRELPVVPFEVLIGIGFLIVGFIFYVALMAMIGAIFPSSKEATGFSSVFFILPAIPFWGFDAIVTQPTSTFTQILTYFPVTSPTTVLLRNTAGNLEVHEGLISLAVLALAALLTVVLAAKAFRLGTLEYNDRVKFSALLKK